MTDMRAETSTAEGFEPVRGRVKLLVDELVQQGETVYRIAQVLDFNTVIGINVATGRSSPLRVGELRPVTKTQGVSPEVDLTEIADKAWQVAEMRFAAIQPFIDRDIVGRTEVEQRAREVGADPVTLYRWLKLYRTQGTMTALVPRKRGWKNGQSRLPSFAEGVIEEVIREYYLTKQRPSVQDTITEVRRRCLVRGITLPSPSAIRLRIGRIPDKDRLRGRGFVEKARNKFRPVPGTFPGADYPLAVVQIDHTRADIIVVDDVYRKPIGRPLITLAVDVYSTMVVGYHLSLGDPSEATVGLCLAHAILPKTEWLQLHDVEAEWPVWGFPNTVHVDNGAEFRSDGFRQACKAHNIKLEFRPVRLPHYGGTVERVYRTINQKTHTLPGTTFSSVKDREGYDSEKEACMTLGEYEQWMVDWICRVYHTTPPDENSISPLSRWHMGIFGSDRHAGIGPPPVPADPMTVMLDFLPTFQRTVQAFGVTIDGLTYYADVLQNWIGVENPNKNKKTFTFRRDPRDISVIWFFDPVIKQYFKVPLADQRLPTMSVWELQQSKVWLKQQGIKDATEEQILRAVTDLRAKVDAAQERSKQARRQAQRRKQNARKVNPAAPLAAKEGAPVPVPANTTPPAEGLLDGDVTPFGEIA